MNIPNRPDSVNPPFECLAVLYLADNLEVLKIEGFTDGLEDSVGIPCEVIVGRAMRLQAKYVQIAHNHPHEADPSPSDGDIAATASLLHLLTQVNVILREHEIVGNETTFSMRRSGMIANIALQLLISELVNEDLTEEEFVQKVRGN